MKHTEKHPRKHPAKALRRSLRIHLPHILFLLVASLLAHGRSLVAQSVHASVWSSTLDHSLESVVIFQSQSPKRAEATIHVYEELPAQQIASIGIEPPTEVPPTDAYTKTHPPVDPPMDLEADAIIVNPLRTGAVDIISNSGKNIDFLLIMQLSQAVKPLAYRISAEVTGSKQIESVAFSNPDGTRVLFTVNHSETPMALKTFWKDRLFHFTQAGNSMAVFAWDPKSQLVSLDVQKPQHFTENTVSLGARCSQISPLGIDLRCESSAASCTVFPVYFTCDSDQASVPLTVTVRPTDHNQHQPVFVTVTAAPDVGELTALKVSSTSREP